MSVSSCQSAVERSEKDIAALNAKLAAEYKKESDAMNVISREQKSITKTTSPTMLRTKQNRIDSENKKIADSKKKQADITKDISRKQKELASKRTQLLQEQGRESRELFAKQERAIQEQTDRLSQVARATSEPTSSTPKECDFFISHASEDKEEIAIPLYRSLTERGAVVWLDKYEMRIGDSLRKSLDKGLAASKHGIVILSKVYMTKYWTEKELSALFSKESIKGGGVILPVWHNITKNDVASYSPMLLDYIALKTADFTINELADSIMQVLNGPNNSVNET